MNQKNTMVELFPPARLEKLERRSRITKYLLLTLGFLALGVCVWFTSQVNTRNLYTMLPRCVCVSVGAAWIIIYFGIYVVRDGKREAAYARHLLEGERQTVEGKVSLVKLKVRIRNSVTLRKLRVETGEGPVSLSVHIDKADQLKRAGEFLRLYTVHGYVVAYEELNHENP